MPILQRNMSQQSSEPCCCTERPLLTQRRSGPFLPFFFTPPQPMTPPTYAFALSKSSWPSAALATTVRHLPSICCDPHSNSTIFLFAVMWTTGRSGGLVSGEADVLRLRRTTCSRWLPPHAAAKAGHRVSWTARSTSISIRSAPLQRPAKDSHSSSRKFSQRWRSLCVWRDRGATRRLVEPHAKLQARAVGLLW